MARRETESLIDRLREMSEEGLTSFLNELKANAALSRRLKRVGERLTTNKQTFDRNVETVLDFVNLPSKRDVRELRQRLDRLSGQITSLNIKLDRVVAAQRRGPGTRRTAKR